MAPSSQFQPFKLQAVAADLEFEMAPRTRLDPLVSLREREVEQLERELGAARVKAAAAQKLADQADAKVRLDQRAAADVEEWQLVETAHGRARLDAQRAAQAALDAARLAETRRTAVAQSQLKLEVLRRAADRKREELTRERDGKERKETDAIAGLLFALGKLN